MDQRAAGSAGRVSGRWEGVVPVRSVDEQLDLILVRRGPSCAGAGADLRGARAAQRRGGGRRPPAARLRPGGGRRLRRAQRRPRRRERATPVVLPVVGEIPAGSRHPLRLQPGQAVRVVAGAPLPTLADAVVPVGHTDAGTAKLTVHARRAVGGVRPPDRGGRPARRRRRPPRRGPRRRRRSGCSPRPAGTRCSCTRGPRVSVISVGDELVDVARAPRAPGRCRTSAPTRSPPPPATRAPRSAGPGSCAATRASWPSAVQDRLPFSDVLVVCGAVGGAAGARGRRPRSRTWATSTPPASPCTPAPRRGSAGSARTACPPSCSRRTRPRRWCCSRCWCGR